MHERRIDFRLKHKKDQQVYTQKDQDQCLESDSFKGKEHKSVVPISSTGDLTLQDNFTRNTGMSKRPNNLRLGKYVSDMNQINSKIATGRDNNNFAKVQEVSNSSHS